MKAKYKAKALQKEFLKSEIKLMLFIFKLLFKGTLKVHLFTLQFSGNFLNYKKIWFHVNGVNNYLIILCIFPNISF